MPEHKAAVCRWTSFPAVLLDMIEAAEAAVTRVSKNENCILSCFLFLVNDAFIFLSGGYNPLLYTFFPSNDAA